MRETCYHNESDVKNKIKKLLKKHGWFYWMPPANGYGVTGISDFNCLRDGVFLAIEAKFGKNKPTVNQKGYLNEVMIQSGISLVVSDTNMDFFVQWMEAFDRACEATSKGQQVLPEDGSAMLNAIKVLTEAFA